MFLFFSLLAINLLISNNYIKNDQIKEIPEQSVCESIDKISKEQLESYRKQVKSKLTNLDYVTYIKQFWVGLLKVTALLM